jgi:pimeloyl-ACP methyl ester carboxylesterase
MNRIDCHFQSNETRCAGTLMLPDDVIRAPVIVMAHGFANVRTARLPAYAERFVDAGYAVFTFDYRTFGESDGEPRHLVHPRGQIEDWDAAIEFVKARPEIDPDRLVLWGTSFSGGHVLQVGAARADVSAIISQIPHVSGPATSLKAHPLTTIKCAAAGLFDLVGSLFRRPFYSHIVGQPGDRAAITGDNASQAYRRMLPEDANWEDKVLSRSFLYVPLYSPRNSCGKIEVPTLIVAARYDTIAPASAAKRAARRIPNSEFHLLEADHFDPYFGELFEQNVSIQLDFLKRHVPPSRTICIQ